MDNLEPTDFEEAPLESILIWVMFGNEIQNRNCVKISNEQRAGTIMNHKRLIRYH